MPAVVTLDATLTCPHLGRVQLAASQGFVRIHGGPVLVEPDPVGKSISGCTIPPNSGPCTATIGVQRGYSRLVRIGGRRICLDTLEGPTSGAVTPTYGVDDPGQRLARAAS